jgi:hypothetical protein
VFRDSCIHQCPRVAFTATLLRLTVKVTLSTVNAFPRPMVNPLSSKLHPSPSCRDLQRRYLVAMEATTSRQVLWNEGIEKGVASDLATPSQVSERRRGPPAVVRFTLFRCPLGNPRRADHSCGGLPAGGAPAFPPLRGGAGPRCASVPLLVPCGHADAGLVHAGCQPCFRAYSHRPTRQGSREGSAQAVSRPGRGPTWTRPSRFPRRGHPRLRVASRCPPPRSVPRERG